MEPRFRLEKEMREPVKAYFTELGYRVAIEFWLHGNGPSDVVAAKYSEREGRSIPSVLELVAIELKLSDFAGVYRQAKANQRQVDYSYIAMPSERFEKMRPATFEKAAKSGIGILSIGESIEELLKPVLSKALARKRQRTIKNLWRRLK